MFRVEGYNFQKAVEKGGAFFCGDKKEGNDIYFLSFHSKGDL